MPPPIPVELHQYDPAWEENARQQAARLTAAIGKAIITVHHIGSTAIPGICAKPIIDLIPVVLSHGEFEKSRSVVEGLGYAWWGEYGLPGRRYCTLDDPLTGRRTVQLHCYEQGSSEIVRHLAFRDYLRSRPDLAREYDAEKGRCRDLHPLDSHAYTDCKEAWIRRIEAQAISAADFVNRT
ncbi:MAG: GrpB family protein [Xanthobacteraceae bacterium]